MKEKGEKERREPAPFLMAAVFLGLELWLSLMTGLLLSSRNIEDERKADGGLQRRTGVCAAVCGVCEPAAGFHAGSP